MKQIARLARSGPILFASLVPVAVAAIAARRELAPDGMAIDDAFIFLRYARNLALGEGWVWNPGGEVVEGTTSTLWTLIAAAATSVAGDPRPLLFGLSILAVCAALALLVSSVLDAGPLRAAGGIFALGLFLAARPSFAIWTAASLMDSGIWCATLMVAVAALVGLAREPWTPARAASAAIAQVALALARPESLVAGPALLATAALFSDRRDRRWLAPAIAAVGTQVALALTRLAVFGWPLPNTYYAKIDSDPLARVTAGATWFADAASADPVLVPSAVLGAGALLFLTTRRWRGGADPAHGGSDLALALLAVLVLLSPALAIWEGGDYFPGARPLEPFRPFAGLLLLELIRRISARGTTPVRALAGASLLVSAFAVLAYFGGPARWGRLVTTTRHAVDFDTARDGLAAARRLDSVFPTDRPAPRAGVLGAGAFPWAWRGASRDLLGLNDVAIAHASGRRSGLHGHSAFETEAFFADPPELLLIGPGYCSGSRHERSVRNLAFRIGVADLDQDPRFAQGYLLVDWLDGAAKGSPSPCTYARRDWLEAGAGGARWRPADDGSGAPP